MYDAAINNAIDTIILITLIVLIKLSLCVCVCINRMYSSIRVTYSNNINNSIIYIYIIELLNISIHFDIAFLTIS